MTAGIPVTTDSDEALAAFNQGMDAMDVGRMQDANGHLQRAIEADPDFTYAYVLLSYAAYSPEQYQKAVRRAVATSEGKSQGEILLAQIREADLANDGDRRRTLAQELVDAYPEAPRAWHVKGLVHQSLGDVAAARAAWGEAIALDADFVLAHRILGESYIFEAPKNVGEAIASLQKATSLRPEEGVLNVQLGDAHRAAGDLEQARAQYQQCIEKTPTYGPAYVKLGHVASFLGEYDEARTSYDAGIEQATGPAKMQLANYRSFVNLHEGNTEAALAELDEVLAQIDASGLPLEQTTGIRLFTLENQLKIAGYSGQYAKADAVMKTHGDLTSAIASRTGDADMAAGMELENIFWKGVLAAQRGQIEKAQAQADAYQQRIKDSSEPAQKMQHHYLIGKIALQTGDAETAVKHLAKSDLSNVMVQYELAEAHAAAGNADDARTLYDEVYTHNFNSVEYALIRNEAKTKRAS
jgi:tetratricopeptide (TPR) repeat protein